MNWAAVFFGAVFALPLAYAICYGLEALFRSLNK